MNLSQIKDPVYHMCIADSLVAFWFSNTRGDRFESFYSNDKDFCQRKHLGKTQLAKVGAPDRESWIRLYHKILEIHCTF